MNGILRIGQLFHKHIAAIMTLVNGESESDSPDYWLFSHIIFIFFQEESAKPNKVHLACGID